MTPDASVESRITSLRSEVDAALEAFANLAFDGGEDPCPRLLAEAIRYSLLAPGKRIRPVLTLLAAEACGGTAATAMPAACAVEMVHAYSLIHDDLPAMDDDDLRRGRPTCHRVFGEALAILAGDALLAMGFATLARLQPPADVARAVMLLSEAAGPCQLVGGQAADMLPRDFTTAEEGLARLQAIHRRKTGAMIDVSLRLGGLAVGAGESQLDALSLYGQSLGMVFQITDDLLDAQGSEELTGKRVGKDEAQGKLTFPSLLGVDESRRMAEEWTERGLAAIAPFGVAASPLAELARLLLERNR